LVGNAGSLKLTSTGKAPRLTIKVEIEGTKEDLYCADRGLCNTASGICDCFRNFFTSDGYVPYSSFHIYMC
jgi:hypothetical protein